MPNFNTPQNKGVIWNLMFEGGVFQGINDSRVQSVKDDFDAKVNDIEARNPGSENLTDLNKAVITEMMNDVKKYKTAQPTAGSKKTAPANQERPGVPRGTAKEVSDQRQKQFQKGLETRQNDFSDMMNEGKPDTIDFSDKNDKPIGAEMDNMVASFIAARENQLNVVLDTQDSKEAGEWINKDNTNSSQHIKIGDDAKLDTSNIVEVAPAPKKVSFVQNNAPTEIPDFLNKLKKKPDDSRALHEKLDQILRGQEEILSLLRRPEASSARRSYASQEPDNGVRKYNDDRNWNGEHIAPGI
jgi:hypothetical protein